MDAIRVSAINSFFQCSAKFNFQYIEKIYSPSRIALAFGTSIHAALKKNYANKIFSKKDLSIDEITSEFSDNYDAEVKTVDFIPDDEEPQSFIKDAGIELLTKYQKDIAPRIQPKIVEQKISLTFEKLPFVLTGTLDLIDDDNVLVDHKTTRKALKQIPDGYIRQISGYKYLAERMNIVVESARIDMLTAKSAVTNTGIRHIPIATNLKEFLQSFLTASDAIEKGVFFPNRNSFLCNKKYCPFWNECEIKYGGTVR